MYRFIVLRLRGDGHAADDLLQQTCYEAARHRRIPHGDDAAQAWLFGIAKNLIRKHFRRLRREGRFRSDPPLSPLTNGGGCCDGYTKTRYASAIPVDGEIEAAGTNGLVPQLLTAIATLNETDQLLLLGSYFEGRSHEELARASGVSVRAIEGRLYRARMALREALSAELGENES